MPVVSFQQPTYEYPFEPAATDAATAEVGEAEAEEAEAEAEAEDAEVVED